MSLIYSYIVFLLISSPCYEIFTLISYHHTHTIKGESIYWREGGWMKHLLRMVINKCPDRSIEVKLSTLWGNYDKQINRATDQPTTQSDRPCHWEVPLPMTRSSHVLPGGAAVWGGGRFGWRNEGNTKGGGASKGGPLTSILEIEQKLLIIIHSFDQ